MSVQMSEIREAQRIVWQNRGMLMAREIVKGLRNRACRTHTVFDDPAPSPAQRLMSGVYTDESCQESAEKHGSCPSLCTAEEVAWQTLDLAIATLSEAMRRSARPARYEAMRRKKTRLEALRDSVEWTQLDGSGRRTAAYYRGIARRAKAEASRPLEVVDDRQA